MTRSLCSVATIFYSVELFLCLLGIFFVTWEFSDHCVSFIDESRLLGCDGVSNNTNKLSRGVFTSIRDEKRLRSLLVDRLTNLETVSCVRLNPFSFNFSSGPKYSILLLVYVFIINSLLCLVMFFRHRLHDVSNRFYRIESMIVTVFTALIFAFTIWLQEKEYKRLRDVPTGSPVDMELEAPTNWIKASMVAILAFIWKILHGIFQGVKGEQKITVEHPVFKIFDFSKNYAAAPKQESNA